MPPQLPLSEPAAPSSDLRFTVRSRGFNGVNVGRRGSALVLKPRHRTTSSILRLLPYTRSMHLRWLLPLGHAMQRSPALEGDLKAPATECNSNDCVCRTLSTVGLGCSRNTRKINKNPASTASRRQYGDELKRAFTANRTKASSCVSRSSKKKLSAGKVQASHRAGRGERSEASAPGHQELRQTCLNGDLNAPAEVLGSHGSNGQEN